MRFLLIVFVIAALSLGALGAIAATQDVPEGPKPDTSCGPLSLAVCLAYSGQPARLTEIHAGMPGVDYTNLCRLSDLKAAADRLGVATRGIRLRSSIDFLQGPAVFPVVTRDGRKHFVAALSQRDDRFLVVDFPASGVWVPESTLRDQLQWQGEALLIGPQVVRFTPPAHVVFRLLLASALAGALLPPLVVRVIRRAG